MRLEVAELAEMHLEVFEQSVDELGALSKGCQWSGGAVVEMLQIVMQQLGGKGVEGLVACILEPTAEHVEQRLARAIVVQRLYAQMTRDGEHKKNGRLDVDSG